MRANDSEQSHLTNKFHLKSLVLQTTDAKYHSRVAGNSL